MVRDNTRGSLPAWKKPVDQGSNPCVPTIFRPATCLLRASVRRPSRLRLWQSRKFADTDVDPRAHPHGLGIDRSFEYAQDVIQPAIPPVFRLEERHQDCLPIFRPPESTQAVLPWREKRSWAPSSVWITPWASGSMEPSLRRLGWFTHRTEPRSFSPFTVPSPSPYPAPSPPP